MTDNVTMNPEDRALWDRYVRLRRGAPAGAGEREPVGGNDARYINHSCDPNCEALDKGGRIFIHAMRTIRRGEELNYDYQFAAPGRITKTLREFYVCHCGTKKCRGTILAVKPSQNGNGRVNRHPGRHAEHARTKRSH